MKSAVLAPQQGEPIVAMSMDGRLWATTVGHRMSDGHPVARDGALTLFPEDEGVTWARGHDTPEAGALKSAVALGLAPL